MVFLDRDINHRNPVGTQGAQVLKVRPSDLQFVCNHLISIALFCSPFTPK